MADSIAVIQATLAPAFLISGTSIFLNFTQQRLFRVVDRVREVEEGRKEESRLAFLHRRALLLRNAIAMGVATVALTVISAMLLMFGEMLSRPSVADFAPYVFALAMLGFFVALALVLHDTVLSVRSVTEPRAPRGNRGRGQR